MEEDGILCKGLVPPTAMDPFMCVLLTPLSHVLEL